MFRLSQISRLSVLTNREFSTKIENSNLQISPDFVNRNPRNLERMRIGYKPDGYHVEKSGRRFWHKLKLTQSGRYAYASVEHFENGEVLKASTLEWALKKQLYKCNDSVAFYNLGRVLADRCLKAGLIEMYSNIELPKPDGKVAKFLKGLQEGGVVLEEPPQFKPARPWDQYRPEKPWEITD
jgi:large subunit ribosomal protein L18